MVLNDSHIIYIKTELSSESTNNPDSISVTQYRQAISQLLADRQHFIDEIRTKDKEIYELKEELINIQHNGTNSTI